MKENYLLLNLNDNNSTRIEQFEKNALKKLIRLY